VQPVRWPLCVFIGVSTLTNFARAQPYDALYVFGDSYSDIGARFVDTNGPTAVAYLAQRLGIAMTYPQDPQADTRSLDFAASGAGSGKEHRSVLKDHYWCCQGMIDQVEVFARKVRGGSISFDPQTTLFLIAGGLNDRNIGTRTTILNVERQISLLKEVGAYHVTLALLPTKIPAFAAVGQRLNPAYRRLVSDLRGKLAIDLEINHWGLYFDEVIQEPSRYGILNTTSRCAGRELFHEDATPCAAPDTYYYFHEGHPSTSVHRIVGDKLYIEVMSAAR
jgi:phospholipase/lecithinase/hemolysin